VWVASAALLLVFAVRGTAGFVADIGLAKIANEGMVKLRRALFGRMLDVKLDVLRSALERQLGCALGEEGRCLGAAGLGELTR